MLEIVAAIVLVRSHRANPRHEGERVDFDCGCMAGSMDRVLSGQNDRSDCDGMTRCRRRCCARCRDSPEGAAVQRTSVVRDTDCRRDDQNVRYDFGDWNTEDGWNRPHYFRRTDFLVVAAQFHHSSDGDDSHRCDHDAKDTAVAAAVELVYEGDGVRTAVVAEAVHDGGDVDLTVQILLASQSWTREDPWMDEAGQPDSQMLVAYCPH